MNRTDIVLTPNGLRYRGNILPCTIGLSGITTTKVEGDGATPAGTHCILARLYRADRLPRPASWARPIGPCDAWCDAPDHRAYNTQTRHPFDASHERLARADPLYDIILITDWNTPAMSGQGSAIFIHQWRRPGWPTAGCIGLSRRNLTRLAAQACPGTKLIVPSSLPKYSNPRRKSDAGGQV